MRRIVLSVLGALSAIVLNAQIIDRVYAIGGSVYEGYISEQIPGISLSVYSQRAEITFARKGLEGLRRDYRKVETMSETAKTVLEGRVQDSYVELISFTYDGCVFDDCYMLSNSNDSLRVICLTPRTYKLPWRSVYMTEKIISKNVEAGLRDIVTLISGERIIGQITKQNIGKDLVINDINGNKRIVRSVDVLSIRSELAEGKTDIWQQVSLLDRVFFKDGSMIEGYIASRVMGKSLFIVKPGQIDEISYPVKDVVKYQKTPNKLYQPKAEPSKDKSNADKDKSSDRVSDRNTNRTSERESKSEIDNVRKSDKSEPASEVEIIVNDKPTALSRIITSYDYVSIDPDGHLQIPLSSKIKVTVKGIPVGPQASLYKVKLVNLQIDDEGQQSKPYYRYAYYDKAIYSTNWIEEGDEYVAELQVNKAGVYFLAINGQETGVALEFFN